MSVRHPSQVTRIQRILSSCHISLSDNMVQEYWDLHSDTLCASWLCTDGYTDKAIIDIFILLFLKEAIE